MARYLDPKNDLTFKRIFAEHPDILISFLNALMPLAPEHHIKEIEYLSPEQTPDLLGKKYSVVDVKCKDKNGNVFIIEMQMYWTKDFMNRILFNASKAYVRQLDSSKSYKLLKPVYTLAILNENYNSANSFYHHFQILNKENNIEIIKGLEFVVVELLKFTSDRWSDRKISALWLRFLKEVGENTTELPPEMTENEHIRHAAELCEKGAFTPAELYAYEKYWDIVRTEKTLIEGSREEGIEIGLEKGEAIGLEKGRIEGVINGRRAGAPIDTIAAITGLTTEQITGILKQHGLI